MQRGPNNEDANPECKVEKTWCANMSDCTVGVSRPHREYLAEQNCLHLRARSAVSPRNKTAFDESLVVTHAEAPDHTDIHIRDPFIVEKGVTKPGAET